MLSANQKVRIWVAQRYWEASRPPVVKQPTTRGAALHHLASERADDLEGNVNPLRLSPSSRLEADGDAILDRLGEVGASVIVDRGYQGGIVSIEVPPIARIVNSDSTGCVTGEKPGSPISWDWARASAYVSGHLGDTRRMNVLFGRARWQLVLPPRGKRLYPECLFRDLPKCTCEPGGP